MSTPVLLESLSSPSLSTMLSQTLFNQAMPKLRTRTLTLSSQHEHIPVLTLRQPFSFSYSTQQQEPFSNSLLNLAHPSATRFYPSNTQQVISSFYFLKATPLRIQHHHRVGGLPRVRRGRHRSSPASSSPPARGPPRGPPRRRSRPNCRPPPSSARGAHPTMGDQGDPGPNGRVWSAPNSRSPSGPSGPDGGGRPSSGPSSP